MPPYVSVTCCCHDHQLASFVPASPPSPLAPFLDPKDSDAQSSVFALGTSRVPWDIVVDARNEALPQAPSPSPFRPLLQLLRMAGGSPCGRHSLVRADRYGAWREAHRAGMRPPTGLDLLAAVQVGLCFSSRPSATT